MRAAPRSGRRSRRQRSPPQAVASRADPSRGYGDRMAHPAARRVVASVGLAGPRPRAASGAGSREAISAPAIAAAGGGESRGSVTVVWGPHGAPGRTTVALALAAAAAMTGARVALVDADS